jgi:hypothetical protein
MEVVLYTDFSCSGYGVSNGRDDKGAHRDGGMMAALHSPLAFTVCSSYAVLARV